MFCRIYQWRIEKEMDDYGQIKHSQVLRHLEVCTACQGWLQRLKQIGGHLQTDSPSISDLQMKQVHESVHRHLSDATAGHIATTEHKTYKPYRFRYAISAAAALIVVAIGLFSLYSFESDNRNQNETLDFVAQLTEQLQYQIPALANLPEQQLESEMQNMERDVRHAIGFIQNCLPQGFIAANLSSGASLPVVEHERSSISRP
jgi:hypothetical protein